MSPSGCDRYKCEALAFRPLSIPVVVLKFVSVTVPAGDAATARKKDPLYSSDKRLGEFSQIVKHAGFPRVAGVRLQGSESAASLSFSLLLWFSERKPARGAFRNYTVV